MYFIYWAVITTHGYCMCLRSPMILSTEKNVDLPCACGRRCEYLCTNGAHIQIVAPVDIPKTNLPIYCLYREKGGPKAWPYTLYIQITYTWKDIGYEVNYQWSFQPLSDSDINYEERLIPNIVHQPRCWMLDI